MAPDADGARESGRSDVPSDRPAADVPPLEPPLPPAPPVPAAVTDPSVEPKVSAYRSVFRLRNFRRLWIGMTVSSIGDWIGLFALLSITNRLAPGNTLAIGGLMIFRMLPAFLVGPIAGVLLDRVNRRNAMVISDICRAALVATVPFAPTLPALYAISFALETISLVWMPAKDALVPNLVPKRWLVAANSATLFTTYGVFPLGALAFTGLVSVAAFLGTHVTALRALDLDQENLALWIDTATFLASALIISRLRFPAIPKRKDAIRARVLWDELIEGLRYLKQRGEVARVMRSIAVALAGGAVVFSLGAPYSTEVLDAGARGFGGIVAALGTGMGIGVLALGFFGDRLPKAAVAAGATAAAGVMLVGAAAMTKLGFALVLAGSFGACAGAAYATLFALLQEMVPDEVSGRVFASVQVVIRVSLFASLIVFPALAQLFATGPLGGDTAQGIRLALATGGLLTCAAGLLGAADVYRGRLTPDRNAPAAAGDELS